MSTISDAYRCDECRTWHDNEDDARDCCRPSITEGYQCDTCKTYHLDNLEAEQCCLVTYTCPECETAYNTVEKAEECCGCEIKLDRIPPAQLEQFGQARLAL